MLRKICGPKRDKEIGGWRRLHNEERFLALYSDPNNIWMTKSRKTRWMERVTRTEHSRGSYKVLVE